MDHPVGMRRMNLSSIQGRLLLLLIAFCLLVGVSAGATFWSLADQQRDAAIVNLAGRQRMLVQWMAREALQVGMADGAQHRQALRELMETYDATLLALRYGGPAPAQAGRTVRLPAPRDPRLAAQLGQVQATWQDFEAVLQQVLAQPTASPAFQSALAQVEDLSASLAQQSNQAVQTIEALSTQKVVRLRAIQTAFLGLAALLLAGGAWLARDSVIVPLRELGRAARRIGDGDLDTPLASTSLAEIQDLERNLDQMRRQLLDSREQAQAWAEALEQKVQQRTQELEALYTVSREITSRLSIQDVLRSITHKTRELVGSDVAFLCLYDEAGQAMSLLSASGPEGAVAGRASPVASATAGKVLAGERAQICDQRCRGACEMVAPTYRASHLAAPLKLERQIIGALCVGSQRPGKFGTEAIEVLTKLSGVAAVALQNARLYEQAERLAASEERQRIAAEMHDGLAQTLSYTHLGVDQAKMQVEAGQAEQAARTLERIRASLDQAIADTRLAIASLQEYGPGPASLQAELAELAAEYSQGGAPVHWSSQVEAPIRLPREECEQVARIAGEALLNAVRHSRAARIELRLEQAPGEYRLTVEDDGVGFDPARPANGEGRPHFGLSIICARAARLGGRVDVRSAPGAGTRLALAWPRREAAP